jgi:hypothetical protein
MFGFRTNWAFIATTTRNNIIGKMTSSKLKRRFAPLNQSKSTAAEPDIPILEGIVFDVDGTLCTFISRHLNKDAHLFHQVNLKTICLQRCGKLIDSEPVPIHGGLKSILYN